MLCGLRVYVCMYVVRLVFYCLAPAELPLGRASCETCVMGSGSVRGAVRGLRKADGRLQDRGLHPRHC